MGASAWSYVVPYQDDVQHAFRQLQQQVFANGTYLKPWQEPSAPHVPSPGVPNSIEKLLMLAGTTGTHSLLDLAATMQLQHVSSDVLEQIFATMHPTHALVEAAERGWELWTVADGDYLIVYSTSEPDELYFFWHDRRLAGSLWIGRRRFDRNSTCISTPPSNPALQPTASRARSLVFEKHYPARLRQLNAKPLGVPLISKRPHRSCAWEQKRLFLAPDLRKDAKKRHRI